MMLVAISIISVSIYIFAHNSNISKNTNTKLEFIPDISSSNKVEISNPTFKSKGLNSNPYQISALKGIQIEDDLELTEIKGKFQNNEGEFFYIKADLGYYSEKNHKVKLVGNVSINDEYGNMTSSREALIQINDKKVNFIDEVISVRNQIEIKANASTIDDINKTLTYTENVKIIRNINNNYEEVIGDYAKYDLNKEEIKVIGNVELFKNGNILRGDEFTIDLINSTSIMKSKLESDVFLKILN